MKRRTIILSLAIMFGLLLALFFSSGQVYGQPLLAPIDTSFTYQGRLINGGTPANGTYDFTFALYDALSGGAQVGSTVARSGVTVTDGLFTVQLDFGAVFDGTALYLEIGVRPGGGGAYTTLAPRQALTATPYARYAAQSPWSGLIGVPPGFADGTDDGSSYTAGMGLDLDAANQFSLLASYRLPQTCAGDQVAKWDNISSTWVCASDNGGVAYTAGEGLLLAGTTFSVNFGTGNAQAARGDHNHDAVYINVGEPAGGDLTGTYPNPVIAANAVGSAEIADGSIDMADTRDWMGFDAVRQIGFNSDNSDVYLYGSAFTPSAAGSCLVMVNAYITTTGNANANGAPVVDTFMSVSPGGIVIDPTTYNIPLAPPDVSGNQPINASVNYVWNVTSVPTQFGCRVTDPDYAGTDWGSDETIYCRISYICQ